MSYRKKLVFYYGGIQKFFDHLKWVEKRLKAMVDEDIITMTESVMRINILKQFKRSMTIYLQTQDFLIAYEKFKSENK